MKRSPRTTAIVGLLLLALVGLFPPLKQSSMPFDHVDPGISEQGPLGQRAPLYANFYSYRYRKLDGSGPYGIMGEIDVGRLLAETLVIIGVSGTVLLLFVRHEVKSL